MPEKEGIETIRELRRTYPQVKTIAMSGGAAHDAPLYLQITGAVGAHHTLEKPFDRPTCRADLDQVLADGRKATRK